MLPFSMMGLIAKESFVCLDCETTGLEPETDRIIEVAAARFSFATTYDSFESLIDPECPIPAPSIEIHHITDAMVQGKPKIHEVLPDLLNFIGKDIIIGHGIGFDLSFLAIAAKRLGIAHTLSQRESIDTLRLARLYGESPNNALETLRQHFNIAAEGAHRAMNDVIVNIEVFKQLTRRFKTTQEILERLKKPILLKVMPLGKHKGRPFSQVPIEYLRWAVTKEFDQDLLFSIKTELKARQNGQQFHQASNPFASL